jgi:hypothetical protein
VRWSSARITTLPMMMRSLGFSSTFSAMSGLLPCVAFWRQGLSRTT